MLKWVHTEHTSMDASDVQAILDCALRILSRIPMTIDGTDEFMGCLSDFGCRIDGRKVFFPNSVIDTTMDRISKSKSDVPKPGAPLRREVEWSASGQAFLIADTHTDELRPATRDDLAVFSRVVEAVPGLGRSHPTFIPQDVPLATMELHAFAVIILNSTRPYRVSMYSPGVLEPYLQILEVVCGSREAAREAARELSPSKLWVNTPMMVSRENVEAPMELRRLTGQPLQFSTMPVAGVATPVTLAGALALTTAEVIACNVISLAVDDRVAGWTANPLFFDMKTGIHTQWGPETLLLHAGESHVIRHLFGGDRDVRVPLSVSAQSPGAQSAMERAFSAAVNFMGGVRSFGALATLAHSDVGSTVQLMIDLEIVSALRNAAQGFPVDAETLAEELTVEIAPKGAEFLSTEHTALHFRDVSRIPEIIDRRVPNAWKNDPSHMLDNARRKALELERTAPDRCPLNDAQKRRIHEILEEADARFRGSPSHRL